MQTAINVKACKRYPAGRFETSEFLNPSGGNGQNENIKTLGNWYSGHLKLEGGERKAEKTEETTEKEEEVRAEKTRRPQRRMRR